MKITVFTENSSVHSPTWFIRTEQYRCLYASGCLNAFLHSADKDSLDWTTLDFIILSPDCLNSMRELQYLLVHNKSARIYLPRELFQNYFCGLFYKLIGYGTTDAVPGWMSRIVITETFCQVEDSGWLVSWKDSCDYLHPRGQNLLLRDETKLLLFSGKKYSREEIPAICRKARFITGQNIDYILYEDEIEQLDTNAEQISFSMSNLSLYIKEGQSVTI